jgi:energy-converting hydrogenase A subunit R
LKNSATDKKIFVSDCEGPISKNDNAFELTCNFIPNGEKLFTLISRYDDILADIVKKSGYKAGDTLKLILPFLKAYGVTNKKMEKFSARNILLMPEAKDTLNFVLDIMPSFIVSTSYEQYIRALCNVTNFPFDNTYSTKLDIDKYEISINERKRLKEMAQKIAASPMIEIPVGAKSLQELSDATQRTVKWLDQIFWDEIQQMQCGKILQEVNPIGGLEKANIVKEIVNRIGSDLSNVMYVGDSITDVECFRLVKKFGGLTISFNGNQYAIREAEVAILADNTLVTSIIADVFHRLSKEKTLQLVENWSHQALKESGVSQNLVKKAFELWPIKLPQVEIIKSNNMERLIKESGEFRKKIRGEAIGRLG